MSKDFDICVIGSGAGGGPIAYELSRLGRSVLVLEKGPWLTEKDYFKDELACCRRPGYKPRLQAEPQVLEDPDESGWSASNNAETGRSFWNGNVVGGSSNFMSGFFHRMKPVDFRLRSEFGPIKGANVVDWPISYDQLEAYYAKVERVVGVSGKVHEHPFAEPRSTPDFPYPPVVEHAVSAWIDEACQGLGFSPVRVPRAILPQPVAERRGCEYSGYCGSFGCASGAKGSARAALLNQALATGNCEIRPNSQVQRIATDAKGRASAVEYSDAQGKVQRVSAKIVVVACQAIETSRLLLSSLGPAHPAGLGNHSGQLGRNLVFSAGGAGRGYLTYAKMDAAKAEQMRVLGPFVNRALQDWYEINDPSMGGRLKGGTIEFLLGHPNPVVKADGAKREDGNLIWGKPLKRKLERWFSEDRELGFEVFNDWLPTDDCRVSLDNAVKDHWGKPVARVRLGYHPHDLKVGRYLSAKAEQVLSAMGADFISSSVSGSPPPNLVAGGCRFGDKAEDSVLDSDCRVWSAPNVFVTDGSFMPTGGSVPYTWTIYANAFRVADRIAEQL